MMHGDAQDRMICMGGCAENPTLEYRSENHVKQYYQDIDDR